MRKYIVSCDMGSIKIYNKGLSCFFSNGIGDIPTTVKIYDKQGDMTAFNKYDFLGHFTVKTKAFLSGYDCEDDPIYEFKKGRYFVYLSKRSVIHINKCDEETHS